jgi:hypothetical protein
MHWISRDVLISFRFFQCLGQWNPSGPKELSTASSKLVLSYNVSKMEKNLQEETPLLRKKSKTRWNNSKKKTSRIMRQLILINIRRKSKN